MAAADSIKDDLFQQSVLLCCPPQVLARFYPDVTSRKLSAGDWANETYLIVDGSFKAAAVESDRPGVQNGFDGQEATLNLGKYLLAAKAREPSIVLTIPPKEAIWKLQTHKSFRDHLQVSLRCNFNGEDGP